MDGIFSGRSTQLQHDGAMVRTDEPSPVFVATGLALDLALDDAIAGVRQSGF